MDPWHSAMGRLRLMSAFTGMVYMGYSVVMRATNRQDFQAQRAIHTQKYKLQILLN